MCVGCRESVFGQVSQPHPGRVRAARRALHRPDGVVRGAVRAQRLREGDLAASGVRLLDT